MSSLVSQVVFHPVASQTQRLWSTTIGRDKTYRAVQYLSRFLAWYLLLRGHKLQASRFAALKAHLATARKLMRLGKPLEHLQAALRVTQSSRQSAEHITTIAKQLSYFGYLSYDAVVWASAVKFISLKPETAQRVARISNRFWFAGIVFSITHGALKLHRLHAEAKQLESSKQGVKDMPGEKTDLEAKLRAVRAAQAGARHQLIMDKLDMWIPATNLGIVHFNDGVLGAFGFITSIMALRSLWDASTK